MQVTIFGASGQVGRLVVREALARGYTVVAFVHKNNPFTDQPNLVVQSGDIYSSADVAKALHSSDAVVSCLGSWGRKTKQGNRNVLTAAMEQIVPAMQEQHSTRIVTLTGSGAAAPGVHTGIGHALVMLMAAPFPAGKVFADGEQHMRLLAQSGLDWTSIRSPIMRSGGSDTYILDTKPSRPSVFISRTAVAKCIVDQIESVDWLQQAPIISQQK